MRRLRAGIFVILFSGLSVAGFCQSLQERQGEYKLLADMWTAPDKSYQPQDMAQQFLMLGKASTEVFMKSKCFYNAGKLYAEAGDTTSAIFLLREVVSLADINSKQHIHGASAVRQYAGHALLDLSTEFKTDDERELSRKLAAEYANTVGSSHFVMVKNQQLYLGKISYDEWAGSVLSYLRHSSMLKERFIYEAVEGVDMGARLNKQKYALSISLLKEVEDLYSTHALDKNTTAVAYIKTRREVHEDAFVQEKRLELRYTSIHNLPKLK